MEFIRHGVQAPEEGKDYFFNPLHRYAPCGYIVDMKLE